MSKHTTPPVTGLLIKIIYDEDQDMYRATARFGEDRVTEFGNSYEEAATNAIWALSEEIGCLEDDDMLIDARPRSDSDGDLN